MPPFSPNTLHKELVAEARHAGLRYTSDQVPGILRRRQGSGFYYISVHGARVKNRHILARIRRLAIPPAWEDVWISPLANGHIQATGRDGRGRKQYRYHPRWREQRDSTKFEHMLEFARMLPKIRRRVAMDLRGKEMNREKILAVVVRLLETTVIRVGNDEYARTNHSYGLTTLCNHHAKVKRTDVIFSFRGKSGKHHDITFHDPRLAGIIRKCQELPGQTLFSYLEGTKIRHVESTDVNRYLREITGSDFTAKDFRTWMGTVLAVKGFQKVAKANSQRQIKENIELVIENVARILGNTPTICRKCYIHPEIIECYRNGIAITTSPVNGYSTSRKIETVIARFLKHRMANQH